MSKSVLSSVEVSPSNGKVNATIICLHGLGANGHDFVPLVEQFNFAEKCGIRFIFPHAPDLPVTINQGMVMPAWYDIMPGFIREDEKGVRASEQEIVKLIEKEIARGIPSEKIIVAGFSQGGAMALHVGLRYPQRLGGIIGLSTYLPLADSVAEEHHALNRDIPIFMAHGELDDIVLLPWAEQSVERLKKLGYSIEFHTYPMTHSLCEQEVLDLQKWMQKQLKINCK